MADGGLYSMCVGRYALFFSLSLSLASLVMFKVKVADTIILLPKYVCETLYGTRRTLFSHWSRCELRVRKSLMIPLKKRSLSFLLPPSLFHQNKDPQSSINLTFLCTTRISSA
jgi:hypothetical protein